MKPPEPGSLAFGFHPTKHGFGWVTFASPLSIYDCGLCEARSDKNAKCLRRLEKLFAKLEPHTLVLETFEAPAVRRSERVVRLCKAAAEIARGRGMDVVVYGRDDIKSCFASVGAASRQEIAETIARSFESLRHRLPKPRNRWEGQPRRMAIFDAAAVVLAHFQLGTSRLFDDLLD
ncbi:MAG TPA: hypothetical protein VFW19_02720 [Allosphingosinicella sp.]|nr:hypothetical protein [Allosphingosinicella sp.]